jgi:Type II secretion system (T2SS), protein E, N-terminal domain
LRFASVSGEARRVPKTLSLIAVEAGLVSRADLARAEDLADEQRVPLVVVLVREFGLDEVALVGALRRELRVLAIDPRAIRPDTDALRELPREVCRRLRVVPLQVRGGDPGGDDKEIWLAMADPTDHGAIAEVERHTGAVVDVAVLPLSAIEDLGERGYQELNTQVVRRSSRVFGGEVSVSTKPHQRVDGEALGPVSVEVKVEALVRVLIDKGVITADDYDAMVRSLLDPA